jgi:putative Mg2+ transporter-C (MgtC) family protein
MDDQVLDLAARLGCALVTSATIGFERESHGRAAGLRTTVLVGVAGAVAMVLSGLPYINAAADHLQSRPDPSRLAAGVLTGMGFLGAGTILKEGHNVVRGVTTAATLWLVSIIGLAFGAGEFVLGACGWVLALVTLFVLPRLEHLVKNDWYSSLTLVVGLDGISLDELRHRVISHGVRIKRLELDYDLARQTRTLTLELKYKKQDLLELSRKVMADLVTVPGVQDVRWS